MLCLLPRCFVKVMSARTSFKVHIQGGVPRSVGLHGTAIHCTPSNMCLDWVVNELVVPRTCLFKQLPFQTLTFSWTCLFMDLSFKGLVWRGTLQSMCLIGKGILKHASLSMPIDYYYTRLHTCILTSSPTRTCTFTCVLKMGSSKFVHADVSMRRTCSGLFTLQAGWLVYNRYYRCSGLFTLQVGWLVNNRYYR